MKNYSLMFVIALFIGFGVNAQTYDQFGIADANGTQYDTIVQYDDTLTFTFTGMPMGAYGTAHLWVYLEGDFGDGTEYVDVWDGPVTSLIGSSASSSNGDCGPVDSSAVNFPGANLDTWQSAGSWSVSLIPTSAVDLFCATQRLQVRLTYDYCVFGTPVEFASIIADTNQVCNHTPTNFTLTPVGGTLVGPGVTGSTFDPAGLAPGVYDFTYTATDAIGCTTSASTQVTIENSPGNLAFLLCEGDDSPVLGNPNVEYAYASDVNFTSIIDTAYGYVYGPIVQSPDVIYYSNFSRNDMFTVDTVTNDNAVVIDHNTTTGDDRGGIAITDSTVYVIGDNNTARYDLDLTSPGVSLPIMDGLFSDLKAKKIYTLYDMNSATTPNNYPLNFDFNAIAELDADLNLTGAVIPLSETVPMGDNIGHGVMLSGYGKLGIYNGSEVYVVDVLSGVVDSIGQFTFDYYYSENWLDWGNLGFNGTDWIAYYRDWNFNQIVAHNLTTDVVTPVSQFTDVQDLSSFTYHPDNNRLYFHHEYSGQFGGSSETLGYVDASATIVDNPTGDVVGCPSQIEFTFNTLNLGNDTIICQADAPFVVEAGFGYNSYTWNGNNNNWNIYPVSQTETVVASVVDDANCTLTDTIEVTVSNCASLEELASDELAIYPNPNNGSFNVTFGTPVANGVIEVVDMNGKVCHAQSWNELSSTVEVETKSLHPGMYIVTIGVDDTITKSTIVVQ